ncbi:MAG: hypothetical protein IIC50_00715 [Planctomycetes bacterium]|nr:hypothetical protein [Planctomycetota bacterium]
MNCYLKLNHAKKFLVCLNQPNRRMRTRMSGGEGGGPYPDGSVVDAAVFASGKLLALGPTTEFSDKA